MSTGRVTPLVGLTFIWKVIRSQYMITVSCVTKHEAKEDVEISMVTLEHRLPAVEGLSSPGKLALSNR
jgi:hypothetical protein